MKLGIAILVRKLIVGEYSKMMMVLNFQMLLLVLYHLHMMRMTLMILPLITLLDYLNMRVYFQVLSQYPNLIIAKKNFSHSHFLFINRNLYSSLFIMSFATTG